MLTDTPVTDCHTHVFPAWRRKKLVEWTRRALPDHPIDPEASVDDIVGQLTTSGVTRWINLLFPIREGEAPDLHRFNAKLAASYPGCVPVGGVHVRDPDPHAVVAAAVEDHGSIGIKLHPLVQRFRPTDPRLEPALEYLDRRGGVVYIHSGFEEWYGLERQFSDVEAIARRFEGIVLVLPHLAYPQLGRAVDLAVRHPNVWLDLTNLPTLAAPTAPPRGVEEMRGDVPRDELAAILKDACDRVSERIVHGTDHPGGLGTPHQLLEAFLMLGWSDGMIESVLSGNPDRLLTAAVGNLEQENRGG